MQGVDLLDPRSVDGRPAIFGEVFTHDAVDLVDPAASLLDRWVVAGDWKLIAPTPRNVGRKPELFDVVADPSESRDLADGDPTRVAELRRLLDAWWKPGG